MVSMEGPPVPLEKKEKELITDEQASEAYRARDIEKFQEWVTQEQERQPKGNNGYPQLFFEKKLADIQIAAGEREDAIERLSDLANRARIEYVGLETHPPDIPQEEKTRRHEEMSDFEAACDEMIRELQR